MTENELHRPQWRCWGCERTTRFACFVPNADDTNGVWAENPPKGKPHFGSISLQLASGVPTWPVSLHWRCIARESFVFAYKCTWPGIALIARKAVTCVLTHLINLIKAKLKKSRGKLIALVCYFEAMGGSGQGSLWESRRLWAWD